jgi:hypothetical protein
LLQIDPSTGRVVARISVTDESDEGLYWRGRATLPGGFILSLSATLRVAGLVPRVRVEHPTV